MRSLAEMTPAEVDKRVISSRRLLAECRMMPTPDNAARMATEIGILESLRRTAPESKRDKIARLIAAYMDALPPPVT